MKGRRNKALTRGFTIIEVMVSFILFLAVAGIVLNILVFANSYWSFGNSRMDAGVNAMVAVEKIRGDMKAASYDSITNNTQSTPCAFSFSSAVNEGGDVVTDSGGVFQPQKMVIYYIPNKSTRLLRKEFASSDETPLTLKELSSYCNGGGQTVANNVTGFAASVDDTKKLVNIYVETEVVYREKRNTMNLSLTVKPY